jgi:hypothetical protein
MLIWHIARRLRPPQSAGRALLRRQLYGPELRTLGDYFERCDRLRAPLAPHVVGLLGVAFGRPRLPRQHDPLKTMDAYAVRGGRGVPPTPFPRVPDEVCRSRTRARPPEVMASATPNWTMSPVSSSRPSQAKDSTQFGMAPRDGDDLTGLLSRLARARRRRPKGVRKDARLSTRYGPIAWRRPRAS